MSDKLFSKSSAEMTPEFLEILYALGENQISVKEAFSITLFSKTFERMMVQVDSENAETDFDKAVTPKKRSSNTSNIFSSLASIVGFDFRHSFHPSKVVFVDAILLFVCKPDDAEVAAGDLFEELEKVKSRHGSWYCNIWFMWELVLLVIAKGRKRITKSVFGPLVDLWKRKSS